MLFRFHPYGQHSYVGPALDKGSAAANDSNEVYCKGVAIKLIAFGASLVIASVGGPLQLRGIN